MDRDIVIESMGERIKELKDELYTIKITGVIEPLTNNELKSKAFKKFIKDNKIVKEIIEDYSRNVLHDKYSKIKKLEKVIEANDLDQTKKNVHITRYGYIRVAMFLNVEELLEKITSCKDEYYNVIDDYKVRTDSLRYNTFVKNLTCKGCGLRGCFLALEKTASDKGNHCEGNKEGEGYHLNLYALNDKGQEVLMTKDHIKPKSKGGLDNLDNLQTMCVDCNERKADKYE